MTAAFPTRVLVVAPHPDDETIGCGGTLLRYRDAGIPVHWMIVTSMTESTGFTAERQAERQEEIRLVAERYGFASVIQCGLPTTMLDALPRAEVVQAMTSQLRVLAPTHVYLPHPHDVHSDHNIVFQAALTNLKWFRLPSVTHIYTYETLSETEFGIDASIAAFRPNTYVDIGRWLHEKLDIMQTWRSELGTFPFPRSLAAMEHQARLRGSASGFEAAEAFCLLMQRDPAQLPGLG